MPKMEKGPFMARDNGSPPRLRQGFSRDAGCRAAPPETRGSSAARAG